VHHQGIESKFHQGSLQTFHGRLGNARTIHGKWMQVGSLRDNPKKLGTYDHQAQKTLLLVGRVHTYLPYGSKCLLK
jgi:hypothetical protein